MNLNFEYYPKINEKILSKDIESIKKNKENWQAPFFTDTESYINIKEIENVVSKVLNKDIKNIIILGTGGSIQTMSSLAHLSNKRIYSITSSRAVELSKCLDETKPYNSVVVPISRSGETLDVNATIGIFLDKGYNFIGLSSRGIMNDLLKKINAPILDVPDLSGRFAGSITNVGIVPAYLSGIDINKFLEGLKEAYNIYMNLERNPSIEFASFLFNLYKKGYKIVFSMPYSKNLEGSVGLLVQEISESSGKEGKGLMGTYQEAPLCQHSVLEYILGGFKGAVIPILYRIENENPDLNLKSSIDYISEKSAQKVVDYQADATFQALIEEKIPSGMISINNPDEKNIASLIAFIQSSVYYLCLLLNVDWASNPQVNIGKKICNDALKNNLSSKKRMENRLNLAKEKFKDFF
ncbi:MAG: hypothetical protein JXA54_11525 [Candidatus Heimdallarchaeota archaeon]|nr:hypothetical protein [Candidatus Heimdallarchaeota archaeon]